MHRAAVSFFVATALLAAPACVATSAEPPARHEHHAIDYIEIPVLDMAESQRFYGAAFGWTFQDYGPDYAGIRRPDGSECGGFAVVASVTPGGPLVILFSEDLEVTVSAVRAAGGTIVTEPFAFPGGRRFHFADPSGHELAVWAEDPAQRDA